MLDLAANLVLQRTLYMIPVNSTLIWYMEPDGQRDHTKDETGHNGILSASHGTAVSEIPNQHLIH